MRDIFWVGSSRDDVRAFPAEARREVGFALRSIQLGGVPDNAKQLRGFRDAGVYEIVANDEHGTYRVVCAVKLPGAIYVLHAFQKKSTQGIATPQRHLALIRQRLTWAKEHAATRAEKGA